MIVRYKATTADGARFYFTEESKARAFAARVGGEYRGLVTFLSIADFMAQHQ